MIRVVAFTGGKNVPSARFRVRQLIPALKEHNVTVDELASILGTYPPVAKLARPFWAIGNLLERIPDLIKSYRYDLTLLQREFLSTYKTLECLAKRPLILDVDDAIWLSRDNQFAGRIAANCETIICGNDYLANYFERWNKNIVIIPTAVDTIRFSPCDVDNSQEIIIGWTGSGPNLRYLYQIERALHQVLELCPNVKLRIVSDRRPSFTLIPENRIDYIQWSPANEVSSIQSMNIGIMPLSDSEWERGKCSYKMLLYMACGIPVIASPIGMNSQVLALGNVGIKASNQDEWITSLRYLISHSNIRSQMGNEGRKVVLETFSVEKITPTLVRVLNQALTDNDSVD